MPSFKQSSEKGMHFFLHLLGRKVKQDKSKKPMPSTQDLLDTIQMLEAGQEYLLSSCQQSTLQYENQLRSLRQDLAHNTKHYQILMAEATAEIGIMHIQLEEQATANGLLTTELLGERQTVQRLYTRIEDIQYGLKNSEVSNANLAKKVEALMAQYEGQLESERQHILDLVKDNERVQALVKQRNVDLQQAKNIQDTLSCKIRELEDFILQIQAKISSAMHKQSQNALAALPASKRWMPLLAPGQHYTEVFPHVNLVVRDIPSQGSSHGLGTPCEHHDALPPPYDVVCSLRKQVANLEASLTASREEASPHVVELEERNAELRCLLERSRARQKTMVDCSCATEALPQTEEAILWKQEAMTALRMAKEWKARASELTSRVQSKESQYEMALKALDTQYISLVGQHAQTMQDFAQAVVKLEASQNENLTMQSRLHSMQLLHDDSRASMEKLKSGMMRLEEEAREWRLLAGSRQREIDRLMEEKTSLENERANVLRYVVSERSATAMQIAISRDINSNRIKSQYELAIEALDTQMHLAETGFGLDD